MKVESGKTINPRDNSGALLARILSVVGRNRRWLEVLSPRVLSMSSLDRESTSVLACCRSFLMADDALRQILATLQRLLRSSVKFQDRWDSIQVSGRFEKGA